MAVVLGTNAGFVTEAPTANPGASNGPRIKNNAIASKFVAPDGATSVVEIGWYEGSSNTEGMNNQVGIYSHDSGNDVPNSLLGFGEFVKPSGPGWHVKTGLNIAITGGTTYWIAAQSDPSSLALTIDYTSTANNNSIMENQTGLADPWVEGYGKDNVIYAIYALYEEAPVGFTRKIKISGTFQDKPIKTKVAGTFEDKPIKIKVGGTFQDA